MNDNYRLEVDGIIVASPKSESELFDLYRKYREEKKVKKLMKASSRQPDCQFKTLKLLEIK